MLKKLLRLLHRQVIDPEVMLALSWKKPSSVEVIIREDDGCYFAKVTSLEGNVVTQASTGQELFEMVNDAIYDYLDIPDQYRPELGYFLPPEELREQLKIKIPAKFLNRKIGLARA